MNISNKQGEYVSLVHSYMKETIKLTAKFETYAQNVSITTTYAKTQERSIAKSIEVESFLRRDDGINKGCVHLTNDFIYEYSVVDFKSSIMLPVVISNWCQKAEENGAVPASYWTNIDAILTAKMGHQFY